MLYNAVFMFCNYEKTNTKERFDSLKYRWLWVAEAIMKAALMCNNHSRDDDGGKNDMPESVVFAAGVFYGSNGCMEDAINYQKVRLLSSLSHIVFRFNISITVT